VGGAWNRRNGEISGRGKDASVNGQKYVYQGLMGSKGGDKRERDLKGEGERL